MLIGLGGAGSAIAAAVAGQQPARLRLHRRLSHGLGRADWLADPRFGDNAARRAHATLLDSEVARRFVDLSFAGITALLDRIALPYSKVNDIRGVLADPHFVARCVFLAIPDTVPL